MANGAPAAGPAFGADAASLSSCDCCLSMILEGEDAPAISEPPVGRSAETLATPAPGFRLPAPGTGDASPDGRTDSPRASSPQRIPLRI